MVTSSLTLAAGATLSFASKVVISCSARPAIRISFSILIGATASAAHSSFVAGLYMLSVSLLTSIADSAARTASIIDIATLTSNVEADVAIGDNVRLQSAVISGAIAVALTPSVAIIMCITIATEGVIADAEAFNVGTVRLASAVICGAITLVFVPIGESTILTLPAA